MSNRYKNTIAFANQNITTVKVTFDDAKQYAYKVTQEMAKTLAENDFVVVESDAKRVYSVAKVVSVDEYSDISPDSEIEYKWVISKVETTQLKDLKAKEDALVKSLIVGRRKSLAAKILEGLEKDGLCIESQ